MELKRYGVLILRYAWLILLGIIIAGGIAYLVNKNTTPVYGASSRLLIDEAPGSGSGNDYSQVLLEQRLALTYVEILTTRPVLQETIKRLDLPFTTGRLSSMISFSAPPDTQIIVVNVEDTDPGRAAEIANTLGEVFIDQNRVRESLRYAEPIANWQQRQAEIADEIEELEASINTIGVAETAESQASLSRLETELRQTEIRYTEAFNNLNDLQINQAKESSNIVQIEPAQPILSPIRPRTLYNTLLAALTGGLLALGIVFLIEYLDDTIKTPDEVSNMTGLSTLGAIAMIKGGSLAERMIPVHAPRDPISEAYRVMRTNLGFSSVDSGLDSLLITSSSPGEGKSTTVANLAAVMAQTGKRVIVIDADLRRPTQHKFFELSNNQGLTTALLDKQTPVIGHLQQSKIPGLRVLTSGPIPPNPAELLNSQRMEEILEDLKEESDLLIFDTPPTLTVADASILAPQMNGCLLIVEVGKTKRDTLVQATQRLQKTNATIFGVVMNLLRPVRSGYSRYYYYNYYYYYSHYYSGYGQKPRKKRGKQAGRLPAWLSNLGKR